MGCHPPGARAPRLGGGGTRPGILQVPLGDTTRPWPPPDQARKAKLFEVLLTTFEVGSVVVSSVL